MSAAEVRRISGVAVELDDRVHGATHPGGLPLIIRPRDRRLAEEVDAFVDWFGANKTVFDHLASLHGALFFRGFPLRDTLDFQRAIYHYPSNSLGYTGGTVARSQLAERVFDSTPAPKGYTLRLHQEMSYLPSFPRMISFFSRQSATTGGETPLADCRLLADRLPRRLWDGVKAKGVRYERNYSAAGGLEETRYRSKSWTAAFDTEDPAQAEAMCRSMSLEPVWREDGSLSTFYSAPGFIRHPLTGETVWFNQIGPQNLHRRSLGEARWRAMVTDRPPGSHLRSNATYGDGEEIAEEDLDALFDAFEEIAIAIRWQDGDLMLVDNVMTAHGRYPYEGEREVQVALLG
jgi:alpha-ketoglutarate-dependent taurine dioxygenase